MGSALNNDPHVRIYLTLNKPYYYAGEIVQGVIHVDCLSPSPYRALHISIKGKQKVVWIRNYNKTIITYSNFRQTYYDQSIVTAFQTGILQGQYDYPFSLLLPAAFPSSFKRDNWNFIRYSIAASLLPMDPRGKIQMFKRSLHLRQPFRGIPRNLRGQLLSESKCCNCCCSCGSTQLSLEANVVYLQNGQTFSVKGWVDSAHSKTGVKDYKVVLRQKYKQISEMQYTNSSKEDITIYDSQQKLYLGTADSFSAEVIIPQNVKGYTAIGNIISRAYFLSLVAEVSCCFSNPHLEIPVVLLSTIEPEVEKEQAIGSQISWQPVVAQPVSITTLKPYIYMPSPQLTVTNQYGGTIRMENEMKMSNKLGNILDDGLDTTKNMI